MKSFEGKVAAITGAASGIGRALAHALAAQGCSLALADVNEPALHEVAKELKAGGARVHTQRLDVSDRDAIYAWAEAVVAEYGVVNLIFNNAGVALSGTLEDSSDENLQWITNINYWGVVHGCRAFLPHLRASGAGHIVNVSSVSGIIAQPGMGAYNATKFAVRGFSECLRMELELDGAPVSLTCVHPGGIKTGIARSARFDASSSKFTDKAEDVAKHDFEKTFITTPEDAAATILKAVQRDKRRVLVGPDAYAIDWISRLLGTAYQPIAKRLFRSLIDG